MNFIERYKFNKELERKFKESFTVSQKEIEKYDAIFGLEPRIDYFPDCLPMPELSLFDRLMIYGHKKVIKDILNNLIEKYQYKKEMNRKFKKSFNLSKKEIKEYKRETGLYSE